MSKEQILSIIKGAGIAGAGAFVAVIAQAASSGALGLWSPVVGAAASVLVNILRKMASKS